MLCVNLPVSLTQLRSERSAVEFVGGKCCIPDGHEIAFSRMVLRTSGTLPYSAPELFAELKGYMNVSLTTDEWNYRME